MQLEVGKNTKRNIAVGLLNEAAVLILPFVTRTVINMFLGSMYLGLNSLFSSVLSVLSLAELGISGALVFHMYKPIAEGDADKINALLSFYRKAYRVIGLVIIGIGLCLLPFLNRLISGEIPAGVNIYLVYLINLLSTAIGYFLFAYRTALLTAHQRLDLITIVNLAVNLCLRISQIIIICLTRNYYLYLVVVPLFTVINNLWIAYISKKIFPQYKAAGILDQTTLSSLKKLVTGTFIQKVCAETRNSLDSIFVSIFFGLTLTAVYNNYYMVMAAAVSLMNIIINSLSGGIGNHVAVKSVEDNFEELKQLDHLYMTVAGICTCAMLGLFQPFMKLWMGEQLLLDMSAVILFSCYFYILKMGDMRYLYCVANGLWWKMRYRAICETVCNCLLNLILGKLFGIHGIIIATAISLLACNFFWTSFILFDSYFGRSRLVVYFRYQALLALKTTGICVIVFLLCKCLKIENAAADFIVRILISVFIPVIYYILTDLGSGNLRKALQMMGFKRLI